MVLRTLARYDPEGFLDLLETIVPALLSQASQVQIGPIPVDLSGIADKIADRILCIEDPEAIIDELERLESGLLGA